MGQQKQQKELFSYHVDLDRRVRADKTDFRFGPILFDGFGDFAVVFQRGRGGVDDDMVVSPGFFETFFDVNVVRRAIHQFRPGHQSGGLGEPGGIPKAGHFAPGLITRARPAVEAVERGRTEK